MRLIRPRAFDQRAKRAGLDEGDIGEIIKALIERPTLGPVISGTGGARKMRVKLPGRGKSAGARVIYALVWRSTALALLDVYAKSDQADLTAQERKTIARLIAKSKRDCSHDHKKEDLEDGRRTGRNSVAEGNPRVATRESAADDCRGGRSNSADTYQGYPQESRQIGADILRAVRPPSQDRSTVGTRCPKTGCGEFLAA